MDKKLIINTSAPLFWSMGFKTLTMDEVAKQLGVSKKTLYIHFSTKQQLISAIVEKRSEEILTCFHEIQNENLNAIEELVEFRKRIYAYYYNSNEQMQSGCQLKKYYPKIYASKFTKQLDFYINIIYKNLEKGKKEGLYENEIDCSFFSKIFIITQSALSESEDPIMQNIEEHEKITYLHFITFLKGICTPKGRTHLHTIT